MNDQRVRKIIHFYELNVTFSDEFNPDDGDRFRELFKIITHIAKTKDEIRYQKFGEKLIFFQDVGFLPEEKLITGKMRCVRMDQLPEIMDIKEDVAKGIVAAEHEGIVETTHFVINHSPEDKKLALEYHQFGGRINDFVQYINRIGFHLGILHVATSVPIVRNELNDYKRRINNCAEFKVKVHKDNIENIKRIDTPTYTALKNASEHFDPEYATITLKFDYKKKEDNKSIKRTINNILNKFIEQPERLEYFDKVLVKAQDDDNHDKLNNFDLLIDKVKSEIRVLKDDRYRTLISDDIFEKMKSEMIKNRL